MHPRAHLTFWTPGHWRFCLAERGDEASRGLQPAEAHTPGVAERRPFGSSVAPRRVAFFGHYSAGSSRLKPTAYPHAVAPRLLRNRDRCTPPVARFDLRSAEVQISWPELRSLFGKDCSPRLKRAAATLLLLSPTVRL